MYTEVKLFRLTKLLYALYRKEEKVIEHLKELTGNTDYWKGWMDRYHQINESKEIQVVLLRKMGATYRDLQYLLNLSPNTIQRIVNEYDITYAPLVGIDVLEPQLEAIEKRLEIEGIKLW